MTYDFDKEIHALPQVERLADVVRRLRAPNGCPWDRAQTHHSILKNLVEESGEFLDAVEEQDLPEMREELGDLLLQVILHAQIGTESGEFDLEEIAQEEADKLIRRHPHVFGETHAANAEEALKSWNDSKIGEAGAQSKRKSAMDGVPRAMPGLSRTQKALVKAARQGFQWDTMEEALAKVQEEFQEVRQAVAGVNNDGGKEHLAEELGDLLCTVVNLCRMADLEAEEVMHAAAKKFMGRFRKMEDAAQKPLKDCTKEEMLSLWRKGRDKEKSPAPSPAKECSFRVLLRQAELPIIRKIADEVWPKTFAEILSPEQIEYMMEMMYSKATLERELAEGTYFEVVRVEGEDVGYLSYSSAHGGIVKLHKVYLLPKYQHCGIGSAMLRHAILTARQMGAEALRLNVNKYNHRAIRAYERNGFVNVASECNDIGNGFVMDDFVMERRLI